MDGYTIDGDAFKVLLNHEGQYSLWPSKKSIPDGWVEAGFEGSKVDCTDYINEVWVDMRPLSLQKFMKSQDN